MVVADHAQNLEPVPERLDLVAACFADCRAVPAGSREPGLHVSGRYAMPTRSSNAVMRNTHAIARYTMLWQSQSTACGTARTLRRAQSVEHSLTAGLAACSTIGDVRYAGGAGELEREVDLGPLFVEGRASRDQSR
jgi:hypothetical protein